MKRIWFLRNGNHLCEGLAGQASDEYGHKTYFLRVPFGVVVLQGKAYTFDEILAEEDGDFLMAESLWREFDSCRRMDGLAAMSKWAVVDGDLLEPWPTEEIARDELQHFYSENARLLRWEDEFGWVDAGV
ncbi:hypothetical protein [Amycolatopsis kentuckyensis]|uniref:hypothetical protein n=1 Tax=Amycolatopsis kentuckyensis TaxID=218823 RepID=UPI000A3BA9D2|nr:hypothetical protein [Amycolatopsis kentuckyensis]